MNIYWFIYLILFKIEDFKFISLSIRTQAVRLGFLINFSFNYKQNVQFLIKMNLIEFDFFRKFNKNT